MKRVVKAGFLTRAASWILSVSLIFSACPIQIQASEPVTEETTVHSEYEEQEGESQEESLQSQSQSQEAEEDSSEVASSEEEEKSGVEESSEEESIEVQSSEMQSSEVEEEQESIATEEVYLFTSIGNVTRTCPTIGEEGKVTFHYYTEEEKSSVYVKGSWSGDWSEYFYMSEDEECPGVWSVTVQLGLDKSYEYGIVADDVWVGDETNPREGGNSQILRNPSYNGDGSVTIFYYPTGDEDVTLCYKTEQEDSYTRLAMTKDAYHGALLSATVAEQGNYSYYFEIAGVRTEDINCKEASFSISTLPEDDASVESPVVNGNEVTFQYFAPTATTVTLAGQMNDWDASASQMSYNAETGFWSITVELASGKYEYKFVADGIWITDPRNEQQSSGNSVVQVGEEPEAPEEKAYEYTIYYLNKTYQDPLQASMWIWTENVNGQQYFFDETEVLADGNTWLKATIGLDYDSISIIPRAYEDWKWQDVDKVFVNAEQAKEVTIYLVNADTQVYTELPEPQEKEGRYVIVEYTRPAGDYEGWNIYSWNTGYGSEVSVDVTEIQGKMAAVIPVVDTKESISFCMRRSDGDDLWAEKDGGDHTVAIPLDQSVVKATFEQGKGVTGNLPYNTGYEPFTMEQKICFYYRDDVLYKNYEEESLQGKVKLIWDGKEYDMSYDAENQRYQYECELTQGEHYYGYLIDGNLQLDKFNEKTVEVQGETYSIYEYTMFTAELTAKVTPESFNYNQNAVLRLNLEQKSEMEPAIEVAEAYADLSALGQSSRFAIDPQLMAATVAVRDTIPAGKKEIPVTLKDVYGNLYQTTATVDVTARDSGNDFDWDEAVIYFAVTDRFFDADTSNNDPYGTGTYNPQEGSMHHGGDFAGLEQKLDYLQNLGVNTVWITPIVENIEDVFACDGYEDQHNTGYHGYWASDFTKLNRHLGTEEELHSLVEALHARGMKLMVDVVLNHAGYDTENKFQNTYLPGKNMLRDDSTTVQGDDVKDALSGLPDFVTEDREVSDLLIAWQTAWVSQYDIDYFRVDTVKHVDDTTWKAFKNALTAVDPEFKMIGEYAGAGYATNMGQLGTGQMDSLLDFDFNDQALSFVNGKLAGVESFLEGRNNQINNTATMGSFLGSHDEEGLMYRMMNESGRFDQQKAYDMMKVAAALQITAKGQPIIYYGEELGQTGANNWPYQDNRYDLDWSKAKESNDMLQHYTRLLAIRNTYTDVFAKGNRSTLAINEAEKTLVVERSYGQNTLYVGFNVNQKEEKAVTLTLHANTRYTDLYSDNTYTTDASGRVLVTIPSASEGGTVILKAGEAVTPIQPDQNPQESTEADSSENNIPSAVIVNREEAPVYQRMDGSVASGWEQVVTAALQEAAALQVPLASGVEQAVMPQTLFVDINIRKNTQKQIPAAVVKTMADSNVTVRFHVENKAVVQYTSKALAEIEGDLDLNAVISNDEEFGQGFQAMIMSAKEKRRYQDKLAVAFTLGKENAGKIAYIFCRNLETNQMELLTWTQIDEAGNTAITGVDYTDFIILY